MKKVIDHLLSNPQEALAVIEGKAMPVERLSAKELLQVIKTIATEKDSVLRRYW